MDKYLNQDINNPIYLFHGSPKKLSVIDQKQSHDSNGNVNNIDNAIFLVPSFIKATPYAFKDTIKNNSLDKEYHFTIYNDDVFPIMVMKNVNVDENIVGYIYVFKKDDDMVKDPHSYQYKCHKSLIPIDVVEIKYKDYKKYYKII